MSHEVGFGSQILQCVASPGQMVKKRLLYIIPALIFIAAGIVSLGNPDYLGMEEGEMTAVLVLFFGAGLLFLLMGILFVKPSKAVLYDGGFVLTRGSKVTEVDFHDLKGISDTTTGYSFYGIIPIKNTRNVTVLKHDGTRIGLVKAFVPDFARFADELGAACTNFLLKDVTKATIGQAKISFGDKLELAGGQLVYEAGEKKGRVFIPLDTVRNVRITEEGFWLYLDGEPDEKGEARELAAIRADRAWNLVALYRILEMYIRQRY